MTEPVFPLPYPSDHSASFTCLKGCHIASPVDVYQVTVEDAKTDGRIVLWPLCREHYEQAMAALDAEPVPPRPDPAGGAA